MTMIEKVARALYPQYEFGIDRGLKRIMEDCAKEAIKAMREPTKEMSIAGMNTEDGSPTTAYKLMIDAALKEK